MPDTYSTKKITDLTEKSDSDDTDLYVLGNQGTATMRKITFANIATKIRDKLTSLTFSSLNTSTKTLPGAINELNGRVAVSPFLTESTLIPNSTDLDTLTRGAYHSNSASKTQSLSHLPSGMTNMGFRMFVMDHGYSSENYALQIILCNASIYVRQKQANGTYASWRRVNDTILS